MDLFPELKGQAQNVDKTSTVETPLDWPGVPVKWAVFLSHVHMPRVLACKACASSRVRPGLEAAIFSPRPPTSPPPPSPVAYAQAWALAS